MSKMKKMIALIWEFQRNLLRASLVTIYKAFIIDYRAETLFLTKLLMIISTSKWNHFNLKLL